MCGRAKSIRCSSANTKNSSANNRCRTTRLPFICGTCEPSTTTFSKTAFRLSGNRLSRRHAPRCIKPSSGPCRKKTWCFWCTARSPPANHFWSSHGIFSSSVSTRAACRLWTSFFSGRNTFSTMRSTMSGTKAASRCASRSRSRWRHLSPNTTTIPPIFSPFCAITPRFRITTSTAAHWPGSTAI